MTSQALPIARAASNYSIRIALQDLLTERRERQLDTELCRHVVRVENWVDLDQVQRPQTAGVGDQLHQHVRFAIVQPPAHGGAHSRRNRRVADIEVERDVQIGFPLRMSARARRVTRARPVRSMSLIVKR